MWITSKGDKQEEYLPHNEQCKALWIRALTIIMFQSSVVESSLSFKLHHLRLLQYIGSVKCVSGGVEVCRIRFWFNLQKMLALFSEWLLWSQLFIDCYGHQTHYFCGGLGYKTGPPLPPNVKDCARAVSACCSLLDSLSKSISSHQLRECIDFI